MHACSVTAKRLKEQEAEEAYRREIDEHEWCEMFRNLKRHPLSSQIITLDNETYDWLMEELDKPPKDLPKLAEAARLHDERMKLGILKKGN